jgi:hypothetical protein
MTSLKQLEAVVFMDEIDSMLPHRTAGDPDHRVSSKETSMMELEGFDGNRGCSKRCVVPSRRQQIRRSRAAIGRIAVALIMFLIKV